MSSNTETGPESLDNFPSFNEFTQRAETDSPLHSYTRALIAHREKLAREASLLTPDELRDTTTNIETENIEAAA